MDDQQPVEKLVASRSVVKAAARFESRHPDWLVDHALTVGWVWALFWILLLLPADHFSWHAFAWILIVVIAVLPTFGATVVVLSQTPHSHLRRSESVLGHFFSRFAAYVFGFVVWTLSVVLSSAIAVQLQNEGKNNEIDTLGLGLSLLVEVVPVVILFLWLMLIFRYAWFLSRLRGWQARPTRTRIPKSFLADSPRTSRLVVGLAHPGLLAATGSFAVLIALLLFVDDVTIHII
ncbi:hypothetical protein [Leifsonia poae]|uniref:hypothetical protein n=1 Tax=Leifsonia poae TaxID=110933 RepID=UPI001CBBA5E5|nr:hypothetical protein [Leifsonia poae]